MDDKKLDVHVRACVLPMILLVFRFRQIQISQERLDRLTWSLV